MAKSNKKKDQESQTDSKKRHLTDDEFWTILALNGGIFARTARAIEKHFGFPYTRQSVEERAKKNLDKLREVTEINLDFGEEQLHNLMRHHNPKIALDAVRYYLEKKGKSRGYGLKGNFDVNLNVVKKPSWMQDDEEEG